MVDCAPRPLPGEYSGDTAYLSPSSLAVSPDGARLYVACTTGHSILFVDCRTQTVEKTVRFAHRIGGIAVSPDGACLYATCGESKGYVVVVDAVSGKTVHAIPVGHSPCAPVVSPDGSRLYVCNRFDNTVSIIDLREGSVVAKVPVLREPVAADITPDGRFLFIANLLPSGRRIYDYVSDGGVMMIGSYISSGYYTGKRESYAAGGVVLVLDTKYNRLTELIALPNGSTGLRGLCISPDGKYAYVGHVLARYNLPTTQLDRGWMNTNAVSVIDVERLRLENTVLLDDPDAGAANPWGVTCTDDGRYLCVAHSGTGEVSVIDRTALHDRLERIENGETTPAASESPGEVPNDLSFLVGIRRRIRLKGTGPRGLASAGSRLFAAEYFSDSVGMMDLRKNPPGKSSSIGLAGHERETPERRGEALFHDANLCFQGWQSCASCHPDGREDGLSWDLLNDGVGNPKNTRSLLYSHRTPPVMISGIRPDAETAVRAGMRHILMRGVTEDVARALDAYLMSLRPSVSPYLEDGKLSEYARRGRRLFETSGCAECHPAPLYTDLGSYDVGTGAGGERNRAFDTPTLVELWRTSPYLYDGRAETVYEVLVDHNRRDRHGTTTKLTNPEINDLVEYVLSL